MAQRRCQPRSLAGFSTTHRAAARSWWQLTAITATAVVAAWDFSIGTPVDALDAQVGSGQQGAEQRRDLGCSVHGTKRARHAAAAVADGDGVRVEMGLDRGDVAGVAGGGEPPYDVVIIARHRPP